MRFWGSVLWHDASPMKATLHWIKAKKEFLFYCPSVPMVLLHQGQFASWQCLVISGDIFGCSNRLLHSWGVRGQRGYWTSSNAGQSLLPRIIQPKYQWVKKPSPIQSTHTDPYLWQLLEGCLEFCHRFRERKRSQAAFHNRTFEVLLSITPGSWVPVGSRVGLHSSSATDKLDRMELHKISQL